MIISKAEAFIHDDGSVHVVIDDSISAIYSGCRHSVCKSASEHISSHISNTLLALGLNCSGDCVSCRR